MTDRRDAVRRFVRQAPLAIIAFAATLMLLLGIAAMAGSTGRDPATGGQASGGPSPGPTSVIGTPLATTQPSVAPGGPASHAPSGPTAGPTPAPSGDPILIGAGDIADCGREGDTATAALIDAAPGTVFTAGDNAYPDGTAEQFRDCYEPTWGRFRDRTRPAAGNHDWATGSLAGYLGYFGDAAAPNGTSWYSYDLGTWHVIVLDSNCVSVGGCGANSPQGRWLAADLAGTSATCTLAIWHHPRFSSGFHGNDTTVAPFWRTLFDADADLVINGHDHDYERFAPQDPEARADPERGIREFVVGTGGAELRTFGDSQPNSQVRASVAPGVIQLILRPTGYDWSFISTTGEFSDRGTGTCH